MPELPTGSTLPTGTITFLFSDIEGNTPLWERDPKAMEAAMQVHHAILRQAIEANGGAVFKTIGDEFQAAFPTAPQALRAALQAQRGLQGASWNELGALRARMGMHTGEAHLDEGGDEYAVSHTKNRGHRIMEAGHGGQILLSQESADLCQRDLPEGVHLKDLGEHHIRNWKLPERFYQLVAPDLPKDFPPLRTQLEPKHNLPIQLTSFVGREKEVEKIEDLFQKYRLVTLTGAGGVGKTRLALQVARALLDQYPDGIWVANLDLISSPDQLPSATGRGLGAHIDMDPQSQEKLINYLREQHLLLVLDNCEHLIEACARLAEAVLQSCLKVKILATSRERLGVEGEVDFYLPSLSIPRMEEQPGMEKISQYEAVRLFVERAAVHQPGFTLTAHNAQAVGRICAQLDGIPLALELAAPWVRLLPVEQISRRLKENLDFLRGGSRTALPRHQTLRGCLDWSYALLSPAEQELLQALSVFVGGWTLEAAESVCTDDCATGWDILDLLEQLASKSLVIVEQDVQTELRYRLLEPVRQYAQEKLYQAGKTELLRERHQSYFQGLAEQAAPHLRRHQQIYWQRRLEGELPNLRLALDWAYTEDGSLERIRRGLQMAASLRFFWQEHIRFLEGIQWLTRLLELEKARRGDQPLEKAIHLVRANALLELVDLNLYRDIRIFSNIDSSIYLEESQALFSQLGEAGRGGLARLRYAQIFTSTSQEKWRLLEELLPEFEALKDLYMMAECLLYMGESAEIHNELQLAENFFQRSLAISLEAGDWDILPYQKAHLSNVVLNQGDLEKARYWAEQARQSLMEIEEDLPWSAFVGHNSLGSLAFNLGDYTQAEQDFRTMIYLSKKSRHPGLMEKMNLVILWLSQGKYVDARALLTEILDSVPRENILAFYNYSYVLGELEWGTGRHAQARKIFSEILQVPDLLPPLTIFVRWCLAKIALSEQDGTEAAQHLALALDQLNLTPFLLGGIYEDNYGGIVLSAMLAFSQGNPLTAARLFGAADASFQRHRLTFPLYRRQFIERAMEATRAALVEDDFAKAFEEGKAMTLEQALAYARQAVGTFL